MGLPAMFFLLSDYLPPRKGDKKITWRGAQATVRCEDNPVLTAGTQSCWGTTAPAAPHSPATVDLELRAEAGSRQVGGTSCVTSGFKGPGRELQQEGLGGGLASSRVLQTSMPLLPRGRWERKSGLLQAKEPLATSDAKKKVTQSCPTLCNPWTVACQAPLSMELSKEEYWSRLPCPSPGDLPDPEIEPGSPALQADSSPSEPSEKPMLCLNCSM